MSEHLIDQLQPLKTEELIDFALEHLGPEHDAVRQAALQEHSFRTQTAPDTVVAPAGDVTILRAKISALHPSAAT